MRSIWMSGNQNLSARVFNLPAQGGEGQRQGNLVNAKPWSAVARHRFVK
jgi:hypothetical protein